MAKEINSCLMLTMPMEIPVELGYVFDPADLKGTGIEFETHITLLYAPGYVASKDGLLDALRSLTSPREFETMMTQMKNMAEFPEGWFGKIWELGSFENDSDYLVMKLIPDNPYSDWLKTTCGVINKGLRRMWGVKSEYEYTPHITLAELQPGKARKYIEDSVLQEVLSKSILSWGDLVLSLGPSGGDEGDGIDRTQYNITTFSAVHRYFHLETLRSEYRRMLEEEGLNE